MYRYALLLILLVCFFSGGMAMAASSEISDIRFEAGTGPKLQETIHIRMNTLRDPEVFGLQGANPRLVCDFPDTKPARGLKKIYETKGKLIKSIRVGTQDQPGPSTRLVLDLITNQDYTIHQTADKNMNLFTIIVELADERSDTGKTKSE